MVVFRRDTPSFSFVVFFFFCFFGACLRADPLDERRSRLQRDAGPVDGARAFPGEKRNKLLLLHVVFRLGERWLKQKLRMFRRAGCTGGFYDLVLLSIADTVQMWVAKSDVLCCSKKRSRTWYTNVVT